MTVDLEAMDAAIDRACARIAPAWPLDRLIAVNPYWGFVDRPIQQAAADLAALSGTTMLMPRTWYRAQWARGTFGLRHVRRALTETGSQASAEDVVRTLEEATEPPRQWPLLTHLADTERAERTATTWTTFVTRHLSQACAAYFDERQATFGPPPSAGLYAFWKSLAERDASVGMLMGLRGFRDVVASLPQEPRRAIAVASQKLEVPARRYDEYFSALLMSVGGWAAACAFRRWQARLDGKDDDEIVHLLAARIAWDCVLWQEGEGLRRAWSGARDEPRPDVAGWILQRSVEIASQEEIIAGLAQERLPSTKEVNAKAVFCIDVRSEVFRRALEATGPGVETAGFAGFFGLRLKVEPLVGPPRAHLPGLLAPTLHVRETGAPLAAARQKRDAILHSAVESLARNAISGFSFVEVTGVGALPALLVDSLRLGGAKPYATGHETSRLRLVADEGGTPLDVETRAKLAEGVLRTMSMTRSFPRLVAFLGHGASSRNNPLVAGLHCGACGGQTGEVNARALAGLLNEASVREALVSRGIAIPKATWFIAGLHNTTTDDVTLFDEDEAPPSHVGDVKTFRARLAQASALARAERAAALGVDTRDEIARDAQIRARARDGSEVRPEWGLARNAAFVVAPRTRTLGLNLDGRAFLHEYAWEEDEGFAVLETIMTAPMIVTQWINMQYYASTVDNLRYGSGNKVLHNVVGGHIGVFEGAGGDLRIGLPMQSLHNGRDWVHVPLRLSVFIEAPEPAILGVIERHATVRNLVQNEWLFLFRIATDGSVTRLALAGHL